MSIKICNEIIQDYFGRDCHVEEIGNHELGRHYVFKVTTEKTYAMKFYFKNNKWEREVGTLKVLKGTDYKTPKLIDFGVTNNIEWMLYEYNEGSILSSVSLSKEKLEAIYFELGKQVANIHKNNQYRKFGRLNILGDFHKVNHSNKEYMSYIYESTVVNLLKIPHENNELIYKAIEILKVEINNLDSHELGSLCHNDISDRNIIVKDEKFKMLIDFEQASVQDRYREISMIKYFLEKSNHTFFHHFIKGYRENYFLDLEVLQEREKAYMLLHGCMICSWSLYVSKEHYDEGIELLEKYSK